MTISHVLFNLNTFGLSRGNVSTFGHAPDMTLECRAKVVPTSVQILRREKQLYAQGRLSITITRCRFLYSKPLSAKPGEANITEEHNMVTKNKKINKNYRGITNWHPRKQCFNFKLNTSK